MSTPPSRSNPRIALFGGTFDPPHRGHVAIARAAADRFALDQVLFAPAGRQPLKQDGAVATFAERLALVTLACQVDPRFAPSTLDAPRPDNSPNYTVDTLQAAVHQYPGADLFSLAGADSFHTLGHWREPQRLLELAEWIVVSRPGYEIADPQGIELTPEQRLRVHPLNTVHEEAAATGLRERLAHGDPCTDLLPEAVAEYIAATGIYRATSVRKHAQEPGNPVP